MNKKIISIAVMVFLLLFFTTACWNRVELEKIHFILAAGVDIEEGETTFAVQTILPGNIRQKGSEGGANGESTVLVVETGKSVFDAGRKMGTQMGYKTLLHNQLILIGEGAAKEGIDKVIDLFDRSHDLRQRVPIVICRGNMLEIMNTKSKLEDIPVINIRDLLKSSRANAMTVYVDLKDFIAKNSSKTTGALAPIIEVFKKDGMEKKVRINGTAVFKDYKIKGWLNEVETRGLLWIKGEVETGVIVIKTPEKEEKSISLEIKGSKSKITPEIKNGELVISVDVWEEGTINEIDGAPVKKLNPETLKILESKKVEVIKNEISVAIKKAKELNTDIFGFDQAVYRKFPNEWKYLEKSWDEVFPNLEINVNVKSKIRRIGYTKNAIFAK